MADDFDALRTIRVPHADLDAERAERMRARALASVPGADGSWRAGHDEAGSVLTDAGPDPRPALELVGSPATGGRGHEHAGDTSDAGPDDRGRRSFLVVAAAAAVIAVLVGVGVNRTGRSTDVVADQPTTTVSDLADAARLGADRPLAPGEYAHLRVEYGEPVTDLDGNAQTYVRVRETWATDAGVGRERQSRADLIDDAGQVVGTFDEAQDDEYQVDSPGFGAFGYADLRGLPTDPTDLRALLRSGSWGTPDDDATEARFIGQILMSDVTPPGVRAAALTLLAERGATVIDDATDHAGLHGVGVVSPQSDGSNVVYVVSRTGVLLGSYVVGAGAPIDPAAAESWATVEARDRTTTAS